MLFHITSTHDNLSCGGVQARKSGIDISTLEYRAEQTRRMEGNGKVKVVGAYMNQRSHRKIVVVEADNFDDLNTFTNRRKYTGSCDLQPVGDGIAMRRAKGVWGK